MRRALAAIVCVAAVGALAPAAAVGAEDADVSCSHWHYDPEWDYTGPVPVGLTCKHSWGPLVTWTVPPEPTSVRFRVFGAGYPASEVAGGRVEATFEVSPGTELTLEMGGAGEASSVRLDDSPLLVAGGSNGIEPNYVAPSATDVETEEPGGTEAYPWSEGWIDIEWTYFYEGGSEEPPEDPPGQPLEADPALPDPPQPPVPAAADCVVPSLKGLRPIAARKALARANCALGQVTRRPARRNRRGHIVRQSPAPGTSMAPGSTVVIVVGRRP